MKPIKFTEAFSLMDKCILSCDSADQLMVMFEFIDNVITEARFPDVNKMDVSAARIILFTGIDKQKDRILGVGDENEVDIKANTIHHQ